MIFFLFIKIRYVQFYYLVVKMYLIHCIIYRKKQKLRLKEGGEVMVKFFDWT